MIELHGGKSKRETAGRGNRGVQAGHLGFDIHNMQCNILSQAMVQFKVNCDIRIIPNRIYVAYLVGAMSKTDCCTSPDSRMVCFRITIHNNIRNRTSDIPHQDPEYCRAPRSSFKHTQEFFNHLSYLHMNREPGYHLPRLLSSDTIRFDDEGPAFRGCFDADIDPFAASALPRDFPNLRLDPESEAGLKFADKTTYLAADGTWYVFMPMRAEPNSTLSPHATRVGKPQRADLGTNKLVEAADGGQPGEVGELLGRGRNRNPHYPFHPQGGGSDNHASAVMASGTSQGRERRSMVTPYSMSAVQRGGDSSGGFPVPGPNSEVGASRSVASGTSQQAQAAADASIPDSNVPLQDLPYHGSSDYHLSAIPNDGLQVVGGTYPNPTLSPTPGPSRIFAPLGYSLVPFNSQALATIPPRNFRQWQQQEWYNQRPYATHGGSLHGICTTSAVVVTDPRPMPARSRNSTPDSDANSYQRSEQPGEDLIFSCDTLRAGEPGGFYRARLRVFRDSNKRRLRFVTSYMDGDQENEMQASGGVHIDGSGFSGPY